MSFASPLDCVAAYRVRNATVASLAAVDIISGRLLDIFGGTSDAMIAVDAMWRIVAWNAAAVELFGQIADDVLGKHCADVLRWHDRHGNAVFGPQGAVSLDASGLTGTTQDVLATKQSGRMAWLNVSTLILPPAQHEVCRLVQFAREVSLTPGQKLALQAEPPPAASEVGTSEGLGRLTLREREVLDLLARGVGTSEAAARLGISLATLRNHVARTLSKLGVHSRLEAIAFVKRSK